MVFVAQKTFAVSISTQDLVSWAHKSEMTKYDNVRDFMFYESITREQAAKFIWVWFSSLGIYWNPVSYSWDCKRFDDQKFIDQSLEEFVFLVCEIWLMRGSKANFMPHSLITDSEVKIIIERAKEQYPNLNTTWVDRYITDKNQPISRGRLLRILHGIVKNEEERRGPVNYITTSGQDYMIPVYNK